MDEIKSLEHLLAIQKVFDYVQERVKIELHDVGGRLMGRASITFAVDCTADHYYTTPDIEKVRKQLTSELTDQVYGPAFAALTWYNYEARKLMGSTLKEQSHLDYMERLTATLAPFRTGQRIPEDGVHRLEDNVSALLLRCHDLEVQLTKYKNLYVDLLKITSTGGIIK